MTGHAPRMSGLFARVAANQSTLAPSPRRRPGPKQPSVDRQFTPNRPVPWPKPNRANIHRRVSSENHHGITPPTQHSRASALPTPRAPRRPRVPLRHDLPQARQQLRQSPSVRRLPSVRRPKSMRRLPSVRHPQSRDQSPLPSRQTEHRIYRLGPSRRSVCRSPDPTLTPRSSSLQPR